MMRVLRATGRAWMRFVVVFGTVQMIVLLFIIYWLLLPFFAIPYRIFADPFGLRAKGKIDWTPHQPVDDWAVYMQRQY